MKKDERHFSTKRIEEAARTTDAIARAQQPGSVALDQARDRLGSVAPIGGQTL